MPIITGRENVLAIYKEAAKKGWVIPCLCSENLTTTEAILTAASEFATEKGYDRIPITLAITNQYDHRSQSVFYTHTRRWDIGLKLFRASIDILAEAFPNVDILIHLDHAQHDTDAEMLESDLSMYSSVMYDASSLPIVELDDNAVVQKLHDVGGKPAFTDWKPEVTKNITIPENVPVLKLCTSAITHIIPVEPEIDPKAMDLAKTLSDSDLALLCTGNFAGSTGSNSVIGNAGITVAGSAGETTGIFAKEGVPALIMADGPAGLRLSPQYGVDEEGIFFLNNGTLETLKELLPEHMLAYLGFGKEQPQRHGEIRDQYCTAIPIGTALAQSWSEEVCEACGDLVAAEMERFGVHIWLAPAMNIHRLPLCGRNFEYYSEDPLISGKMAAGITKGVQKHPGRGVSVKHFCCNIKRHRHLGMPLIMSMRMLDGSGIEI